MTKTTRWISAGLVVVGLMAVGCTALPSPAPPFEPPAVPLATLGVEVVNQATGGAIGDAAAKVHTQTETTATTSEGYASWVLPTSVTGYGLSVTADGCQDGFQSVLPFLENRHVRLELVCQPPPPPVVPPALHPNPMVGRLRIEGDCFRDDTGCVLPLYAHAGDFFSAYVRDRARVQAQLDLVASAGYHGLRVWSTLGCGAGIADCPHGAYWRGREVGPDITPNYWGQVEAFFRELAARRLRLVWSQGDVGQLRDRRAFMEQLVALEARVGDRVVDWLDCGNEAWQTGEPDPARLAACVGYYKAAGGQALLTLTSGDGETKDVLDRYAIAPADAYDVHSYRGGQWFDKRRHIFSIPYEQHPAKRFGINSEPPGGGELVSASSNKHELDDEAVALLGVTAAYSRQAWVWFAGEGVKLGRGLQGEPGFASTPKAWTWLPKDLMAFTTLHHSGAAWRGTRVMETVGEARVDGRINADGRFVLTIDGPSGTHRFPVERSFSGQICNPADGQCHQVTKKAGETFEVSFVRGRVLVGRVQ